MEHSLIASEDMKGHLILDGGNELLAKRIAAIQKKRQMCAVKNKKHNILMH